jgi:hypothetical protein
VVGRAPENPKLLGCWGVLCLHREGASHGFEAREIGLIRRISPHVAEGLRRAVTIGPVTPAGAEAAVPGMIVLDANLAVVSISLEAERWLAELGGDDWPSTSGDIPPARSSGNCTYRPTPFRNT